MYTWINVDGPEWYVNCKAVETKEWDYIRVQLKGANRKRRKDKQFRAQMKRLLHWILKADNSASEGKSQQGQPGLSCEKKHKNMSDSGQTPGLDRDDSKFKRPHETFSSRIFLEYVVLLYLFSLYVAAANVLKFRYLTPASLGFILGEI